MPETGPATTAGDENFDLEAQKPTPDAVQERTDEKDREKEDREVGEVVREKVSPTTTATDSEVAKPSRSERDFTGWRWVVRNFTSSWFTIVMGTGIVSIILHQMPYNGAWLYYLSIIVFVLNVVLFTVAMAITVVRYVLYPEIWGVMIIHPTQSLFLGTVPMGFATIINMVVLVCVPAWGAWTVTFAWALWWVDSVVAVAICCYLPFIIIYCHHSQLSTMTATWLLPIVAPTVAAATGALIAGVLPNPQHALWTLIISYVMWGMSVPLAMMTLTIYFHRLTMHALPPREVIVSVFLPLGPMGQGGFGIMQLGKVAVKVLPETNTLPPLAGQILYVFGFATALIMWGFGLVWLSLAVTSISRSRFPFNMGWWGFTFPAGTYVLSTILLATELNSRFFRVLGTIFSVCIILLWIVVSVGTVVKTYYREMFFSPCLAALEKPNEREQGPTPPGQDKKKREMREIVRDFFRPPRERILRSSN
jgi:C4-dicarboxylate transporter/malic acid transport protein